MLVINFNVISPNFIISNKYEIHLPRLLLPKEKIKTKIYRSETKDFLV
jgi:hypothetical protein